MSPKCEQAVILLAWRKCLVNSPLSLGHFVMFYGCVVCWKTRKRVDLNLPFLRDGKVG